MRAGAAVGSGPGAHLRLGSSARRAAVAVCAALLAWLAVASAPQLSRATPLAQLYTDKDVTAPVDVSVLPILGENAPASAGFTTYVVRLHNRTTTEITGTLHLSPSQGVYRDARAADAFSETPIRLAPLSALAVELPAVGPMATAVDALLLSPKGIRLGLGRGYSVSTDVPHLFALAADSRVPAMLHERPLPPLATLDPSGFGAPSPPSSEQVMASAAAADPDTGQPLLPTRASSYAPATLVLGRTSEFVGLPSAQLVALSSWVLGGGSLALIVTRDSDLLHPSIVRLLGGEAISRPASEALLDGVTVRVGDKTQRMGHKPEHRTLDPSAMERATVRGFTGGNLQPSPWGASATYGGGEVTLLGFDPERQPFITSRWAELKLMDLMGHAWDRRRMAPSALAATAPRDHRTYSIRRYLLRSDGQHWAISVAALLLIGYAVAAGPLNFASARRKGRPLLALPRLLVLSATALGCVLLVGVVSRGTGRKVRHLSLVDAAAGMPRGTLTRFRAFHGESFDKLRIYPESPSGVLAVINDDEGLHSRLLMTQQGMHLEGLVAKPWQTLHVKEEGLSSVGGGVSLAPDEDGRLWIVNRTGRDLASVVVKDHDGKMVFFTRIADGARQPFGAGRELEPPTQWGVATPLLFDPADDWMDQVAPGVAQAWNAFDNLRAGEAQWWPDGVPMLIAQLVGGRGQLQDSGYAVDSDRALLRVTGFGGTL